MSTQEFQDITKDIIVAEDIVEKGIELAKEVEQVSEPAIKGLGKLKTFMGTCFSRECKKQKRTADYVGENAIFAKKGIHKGKPRPNSVMMSGVCQECGKKMSMTKSKSMSQ